MSHLPSTELLRKLEIGFAQRQEELVSLIKLLVETESPSGDEKGSIEVCNLLATEAGKLSCVDSIERVSVPSLGQHLIVRAFQRQKSNGTVMLVGHTDTVHERGSLDRHPWRVEGNRIYGPGVFDMKSNCALSLFALLVSEENNLTPACGVTIVFTCDEEIGSLSGWPVIEGVADPETVRCALVLEPPAAGGKVKTGRKGTAIYEMAVAGRAAHAGLEPEKGASAILELSRQVERLHHFNKSGAGISVNVGVIKGGTRSNVVAEEAHAEIDVRFSSSDEARQVEEIFSSIEPFDSRTEVRIRGGINRPSMERTVKVLELYQRARELAASLGFELGETQVGGASDGNFLAAKGIPVLDGLGVSGDGAHAAHEHILANDIARRGALLAGLIAST